MKSTKKYSYAYVAIAATFFAIFITAPFMASSGGNGFAPLKLIKALYPENNCTYQEGPGANGGTSHLNILDKHGNPVSVTSFIGEGSGGSTPFSRSKP